MKIALIINLLILLFMNALEGHTQQLVSSSGGSVSDGDISLLEWSLGEVATSTQFTPEYSLTQGFHQPQILITSLDELPTNLSMVHIYPNPMMSELTIEFATENISPTHWMLTDMSGKIIDVGHIFTERTILETGSLAQGIYLLHISNTFSDSLTWKVVKQN